MSTQTLSTREAVTIPESFRERLLKIAKHLKAARDGLIDALDLTMIDVLETDHDLVETHPELEEIITNVHARVNACDFASIIRVYTEIEGLLNPRKPKTPLQVALYEVWDYLADSEGKEYFRGDWGAVGGDESSMPPKHIMTNFYKLARLLNDEAVLAEFDSMRESWGHIVAE